MESMQILEFTKELLNIDSPTGYTKEVIQFMEDKVNSLGYKTKRTNKGNLLVYVNGQSDHTKGICAHVDTLGLMVRSIKNDGTLAFTNVGGPIIPTLDGEYCKVITRGGKAYTGTILSNSPAAHVFEDAKTVKRDMDTMHIRLDEEVMDKNDVIDLGIGSGDYICIDPKTVITDKGFIKSRFLDDKLSVGILYGMLVNIKEKHIVPSDNLILIISTYEEVGHGSGYVPEEIEELLAVDMGCIGKDLACTEYDVSICAKDSSGPYDYQLVSKLVDYSKSLHLNYAVDIYPMYSSDVSAALRGGQDIRGGLIGPGVSASHGMERSHAKAVENTLKLLEEYIQR